MVTSSDGGLECIGVRFSFSKFGTTALGGSNPTSGNIVLLANISIYKVKSRVEFMTAI